MANPVAGSRQFHGPVVYTQFVVAHMVAGTAAHDTFTLGMGPAVTCRLRHGLIRLHAVSCACVADKTISRISIAHRSGILRPTENTRSSPQASIMAEGKLKGTGSNSSKQANALDMLLADHRLVKNLFEQYHSSSADQKTRIAGRLFNELTAHAILEEELFYPAVESKFESADALESVTEESLGLSEPDEDEEKEQDLEVEEINGVELQAGEEQGGEVMTQAYEAHHMMEEIIEQLKMLDPRGSDYQEIFTELETIVIEHIIDEEDVMFPVAASQLDIKNWEQPCS